MCVFLSFVCVRAGVWHVLVYFMVLFSVLVCLLDLTRIFLCPFAMLYAKALPKHEMATCTLNFPHDEASYVLSYTCTTFFSVVYDVVFVYL
jgi:hypothetical protein